MFIDRGAKTPPAPFEGAEFNQRPTNPEPFRSFERSWYQLLARVYKHLTSNGVETVVERPFGSLTFELSLALVAALAAL